MKIFTVILLFVINAVSAQQHTVGFSEIDYRVRSIAPAPPAILAQTLTEGYLTDKEKLRSIFSWITEHIAYRVKKSYHGNTFTSVAIADDTSKWKTAGWCLTRQKPF